MPAIQNISQTVETVRQFREHLLSDRYRPGYHFAVPEDMGLPGDPNGAFYANGRFHLMYLYHCCSDSFRWGHLSSIDLVHWRHHPDSILPDHLDGGIFSGGAFVDEDGTAYITYWGLPVDGRSKGGIRIIKSSDRHYEIWEKFSEYALACTEEGILEILNSSGAPLVLGCADPSNIWKKEGAYYMQAGNLPVLNKYGREASSPTAMRGDWVDLFRSADLKYWQYLHRFYQRDITNKWTDETEDDMCPSFLPLPMARDGGGESGLYLQLFIAHNKGCQYYIGEYDRMNDRFLPKHHGRMSWVDNTYFAPEALMDARGRQIMWAWLTDDPENEMAKGWSGVYGLPRTLWLGEDGTLRMAPVDELKVLRYNEMNFSTHSLNSGGNTELPGINGESCEIRLSIDVGSANRTGIQVHTSPTTGETTRLYYDSAAKTLVFDAAKSGSQGRPVMESAPLVLADGEKLELTVFVDKSVVEVYANDRQAITRRVYPAGEDSTGVFLFAEGGEAVFHEVRVWEMMPSNPY